MINGGKLDFGLKTMVLKYLQHGGDKFPVGLFVLQHSINLPVIPLGVLPHRDLGGGGTT